MKVTIKERQLAGMPALRVTITAPDGRYLGTLEFGNFRDMQDAAKALLEATIE